MCQLCPIPACPSRYNSRGEIEESEAKKEEEEEEEERYRPPSPPAAQWRKTIVQPAPSHDGAPTFAAYQVPASTPEIEAELATARKTCKISTSVTIVTVHAVDASNVTW
ncbi:hypothetical protein LX32DRAFT_642081 [Colletotrichum zoysiae]|uniref:Uncharacterized protein n=1 Tax=Colletotrichum zoysiae TaxID=1216348 RepID=A0AAD9LZ00_9PEZI|nr:hypothetical protein LX32DRAFT_642081 [Colletotrichum zoysiae]